MSLRDLDLMKFKTKRCSYCVCVMTDNRGHTNSKEIDHIQPIARGGDYSPYNLAAVCRTCNASKGAKRPLEWAQSQGSEVYERMSRLIMAAINQPRVENLKVSQPATLPGLTVERVGEDTYRLRWLRVN